MLRHFLTGKYLHINDIQDSAIELSDSLNETLMNYNIKNIKQDNDFKMEQQITH